MPSRTTYNPDVLTCLANLSSDEVFTPPTLANQILDLLPPEIWRDSRATFLDPVCKTGVFLREIVRRLNYGLAEQIPDLQPRLDHICTRQVFGYAITELTALAARRSVYCSKTANGEFSICKKFTEPQGNIRFERVEHQWKDGSCILCGANKELFDRNPELETHAYAFIHGTRAEDFPMNFDVIIGNPPYQLNDGGFGKSASPIYHSFVINAKAIQPRYLIMIIPSRWFAGGKGLDSFRSEMLNDNHIKAIVDFPDASEVFPGVDIAGGVCYFLWDKQFSGDCLIRNIHAGKESESVRALNEFPTLIRHGSAVSIIRKVAAKGETSMSTQVSSRKPFGLATNIRPLSLGDIRLRWNNGEGPYERRLITVGTDLIDSWKVITSKVSYDHAGQPDKEGKRRVLSIVDILPPGTICTETYLIAGYFTDNGYAENLAKYLRTKFVRFLISQLSFSQDITKDRFIFVPILAMDKNWTDEELYKRYGLNDEEIKFIEETIKPMGLGNE